MRVMTEAEAWREIARQWVEITNVNELDALGTCPLILMLRDTKKIDRATDLSMCARIGLHLDGDNWAYGDGVEVQRLGSQKYVDKYREARCLAALWLAHEAEEDALCA